MQATRDQRAEKNPNWRGGTAGYRAMHYRMQSLLGRPNRCDECGAEDPELNYEWANETGHLDDPDDYKRLCKSCHSRRHQRHLNFRGKTTK